MRRLRVAWISAVLALGLVATACGGGGNPLVVAELFALFSANAASADPRISMDPGPAAGEVFSVEINASGVTDLYGAAFTVLYDPLSATFLGCDSQGSVLVVGGAPSNPCDDSLVGGAKFSAALENGVEGVLNVRASLDGVVPGLPVGTGLLLTLTFEAIGTISVPEPFDFEVGPSRDVEACPQDLSPCNTVGAAFDGGTLVTSGG